MSKNKAIVVMVDSNIHREHLFPSEKAFSEMEKKEFFHSFMKRIEIYPGLLENGQILAGNKLGFYSAVFHGCNPPVGSVSMI